MRTLIIPDIHHDTSRVEELIQAHREFDRVVLLGDYFDKYGDSPALAGCTAAWLAESMKDPKRTHLIGNHDVPYLLPDSGRYWCSGWTPEKDVMVKQALSRLDRLQFHLAVQVDGWTVSHAGYRGRLSSGADIVSYAQASWRLAIEGKFVDALAAGFRRGGEADYGGLTWLDWREFVPISGVSQIVGHTRSNNPRAMWTTGTKVYERGFSKDTNPRTIVPETSALSSVNWCIDTELSCVGILVDGAFDVEWV